MNSYIYNGVLYFKFTSYFHISRINSFFYFYNVFFKNFLKMLNEISKKKIEKNN